MAYDPQKDPTVRAYQEAFQVSVDWVAPYWTVAARLYGLWRGQRPWQLDGTFSKIMVNSANSIEADRRPKLKANILGSSRPFQLQARTPEREFSVEANEDWLNWKMMDEDQVNLGGSIDPTLQSTTIMGTGYRMPVLKRLPTPSGEGTETVIGSEDVDFFSILPAPHGGELNPIDRWQESAIPHFFHIDWMTNKQIEDTFSHLEGWNAEAYAAMNDVKAGSDESAIAEQYREKFQIIGGIKYAGKDTWRERMNSIEGLDKRHRVVWWHRRDKLIFIAKDNFKLYEGAPVMGHGVLPLVKYCINPDFKEWFGIGTLELLEDLILAMMMNFNYRMDWLARAMFPAKWIRKDVMAGKPESYFRDRPYALMDFPSHVQDINKVIWYDRLPEITPQHFMEDERMKMLLQDISGMPSMAKGQGTPGLSEGGATGIVTMAQAAGDRLQSESKLLEANGLAQEARLMLAMGAKHVLERQDIRSPSNSSGFAWTEVDPDDITDEYTVLVNGTSTKSLRDQAFQKLVAMFPIWNQNPYINQEKLHRLSVETSDLTPNVQELLVSPEPSPDELAANAGIGGEAGQSAGQRSLAQPSLGGQASPQNRNNRTESNSATATGGEPQRDQLPAAATF
jgi:hypothetical protein